MLEAVVLAGGVDTRLAPLSSDSHPKCLLPVANSPVILYSLLALKQAGIATVLVVASGEVATAKIQKYVKSESKLQGLTVKVVSVPEDSGSADAVRAVADKLKGDLVVVMSGDLVTDLNISTVLFTHRLRGAAASTVLAKSASSAAEATKPGKAPKGVDYTAIDPETKRILSYAYDPDQLRRIAVPQKAVKSCTPMTLSTNYRDACVYILSQEVIQQIQQSSMSSIKVDYLPKLVNDQWKDGTPKLDAAQVPTGSSLALPITDVDNEFYMKELQRLTRMCPEFRCSALGATAAKDGLFCSAFIAESNQLARRVNTLQSLLQVNREMANMDAGQLPITGTSEHVHATVERGNKTVVAAGCLVAQNTSIGDKTSVKRSVVGAGCKIGTNVKILNCVLMDGVVVHDQAYIQNSVIGEQASIGSKSQVKDCFVAHGVTIPDNADHRDEQLATT